MKKFKIYLPYFIGASMLMMSSLLVQPTFAQEQETKTEPSVEVENNIIENQESTSEVIEANEDLNKNNLPFEEVTNEIIEENNVTELRETSFELKNTENTFPLMYSSPTKSPTIYTVQKGDYLYKIGQQFGVTVQQIKDWNKLLNNYIYTGNKLFVSDPIKVIVPNETTSESNKPLPIPQPTTKPVPTIPANKVTTYTVQKGDYLYKIGQLFNVTVQQIKDWNKLTSNYIYTGNKLIVSDPKKVVIPNEMTSEPTKPLPIPQPTTNPVPTTPTPKPTTSPTKDVKTYTVQKGDYLYKIGQQFGVTVQQLKDWNKLANNYIYTGNNLIVSDPSKSTLPSTIEPSVNKDVHVGVQSVLDKYINLPINIYFQSLQPGDARNASLRGNNYMSGQSMPKMAFVAYAQELVGQGILSWNQKFTYVSTVNNYSDAYPTWGTGTIHNGGYGKSYTLKDIVQRTMSQSDNVGANMLRHYICKPRQVEFNQFVYKVYGANTWTWSMTPKQGTQMISYLKNQKEPVGFNAMKQTWWDNKKLDVLPVETYQKVGMYLPKNNHSAGYISGAKPYVLTIMTQYLNNSETIISNIAKQIFNAVNS